MPTLPTISIITPSLNQAKFIEGTIQSVLNQNYPSLEYIVIDGGSSDGTQAILQKYEEQLIWISEPDNGQAHAVNKGLRLARGRIVAFLNSDDLYLPGTLHAVGQFFADHPQAAWLTGNCRNINEDGFVIRQWIQAYKTLWMHLKSYRVLTVLNFISQPSTFWRRDLLREVGYLSENLHYTMDYEYWLRIGRRYPLHVLSQDLSLFRLHSRSKSGSTTHRQFDEELKVAQQYASPISRQLHRIHHDLTVSIYNRMPANQA